MSIQKGNVVIAGDKVFAGIDVDDQSIIPNAMVIEFPSQEAFGIALRTGQIEFTVFKSPEEIKGEDYVSV